MQRGLAMRKLAVCPSVLCPSVCQTRGLRQNGRKIRPDCYTIRKIIELNILIRRMIGGGDPFYLKFWAKLIPLERNRDFQSIFARSASAVALTKKFN